jgi:hypothetical protein
MSKKKDRKMLKPTYGNVPKIQEAVDNLITQMELYREYIHDQLQYELATSGYDEDECGASIIEYEEENREIKDFIKLLKSMSVSH